MTPTAVIRTGTKQISDRDAPPEPAVNLSAALAADLGLLSAAIQQTDGGLEPVLESLGTQLQAAVDSYVGLTITIAAADYRISFTTRDSDAVATTSLRIPLTALAGNEGDSSLVLYAATPGAFVDLAADLAWVLEIKPSALVLDRHVAVPPPSEGVIGLREHATINRAIGALIERGHSPESARTELRRHASTDSGNVHAAAQRILDRLRRPPLPEPA